MGKASCKQRHKIKQADKRLHWKIRYLIDELHHKIALFFVKKFDVVLISKFETSDMSKKSKRKIRTTSVRSMLTFAHLL
jgi:putative transposase